MSAHTEALKQARGALNFASFIVQEFAKKNPVWTRWRGSKLAPIGELQDPCGAHQWIEEFYPDAIAAIDAAISLPDPSAAPVVPQGWKLVPVEPTREMFAAASVADDRAFCDGSAHGADIATLWEVMCDAAPPAPQQGEQAGQEGVQG